MRKLFVLLVLLLLIGLAGWWYLGIRRDEERQRRQGQVLAFDGFEGKLSLDWNILHPDPTHYSLTKKPGTLTITSQQGGFTRSAQDYKNLCLIGCPAAWGKDFQLTTRLSSFKPVADWNQAGLLCYNNDDNYLKFVYEWGSGFRRPTFTVGLEDPQNGFSFLAACFQAHAGAEEVWLRVTKRGNRYTFFTSLDGMTFIRQALLTEDNSRLVGDAVSWGDGSVRRVGIFAKNDTGSAAPEVDASFDFFEVRAVPGKALAKATDKFVVPHKNLQIPEEMQACAANMRKLYAAIKGYEQDTGKLPDWLSDLVPGCLTADALLCPSNPALPYPETPDPKLLCSYGYQFSSARVPSDWGFPPDTLYRDVKAQQVELLGDVVPIVRCRGHGEATVPNLSVGGQVYWSPLVWETLFIPGYSLGGQSSARGTLAGGREPSLSKLPGLRRLAAFGCKASWSPDGTRVVFGKAQGEGLQIFDLETGTTTDLTSLGKDPAWSPDGRYIAYIDEPEFNVYQSEEVWLVRPTGESPRKIMDGGFPNWCADGKTLFVHSRKESKILAMDVDNPDAEPRVFFDRPLSWYPAVSPDGKRIAFGIRGALVVVARETGQAVMTWEIPGSRGLLPAWSPDGTQVAFGGFDNDSFGLWVLDVKTEQAIRLARGRYTMPVWSKDGSKLAFDFRSRDAREVWMVETAALATLKPSLPEASVSEQPPPPK